MPRSKSGSSNGGVIGVSNKSSFGKCTQTVKTSSGDITLQPGTRVVKSLIVAGGGGGGTSYGSGGGAGGVRNIEINASSSIPVTIGGGGAGGQATNQAGANGVNTSLVACGTTYLATGGGVGRGPANTAGAGGSGGGASNPPGTQGAGNAGSREGRLQPSRNSIIPVSQWTRQSNERVQSVQQFDRRIDVVGNRQS